MAMTVLEQLDASGFSICIAFESQFSFHDVVDEMIGTILGDEHWIRRLLPDSHHQLATFIAYIEREGRAFVEARQTFQRCSWQ